MCQCVGTYNARILRILACRKLCLVCCMNRYLAPVAAKDQKRQIKMWCAVLWLTTAQTLGNRWASMRLVETRWDLRTSSTDLKGPHFLFLRSFSNLYNLSSSSPSLSQCLCFLSAAHRWDCLGAPHLTGERPKGVGQKAQGWICWNLLKGAHVSCCLMLSHDVSYLIITLSLHVPLITPTMASNTSVLHCYSSLGLWTWQLCTGCVIPAI